MTWQAVTWGAVARQPACLRVLSQGLVLFGLLGWATASQGRTATTDESRRLRLTANYDVATGCMSAGTFLHKLSEHMVSGGGNGLTFHVVTLYDETKKEYSAAMSFNGSEPLVLHGPECDPILEEAVLEAGMARTLIPPSSREDKAVIISLVGLARGNKPKPAPPLQLPPRTPPKPKPVQPAVAKDFSPFEAPPEAFINTTPLVVSSNIQTARGVMPQQAVGIGLTVSAVLGQIQWEADATVWQPQQWKPWNSSRFPSSSISVVSAGLSACSRLAEHQVHDSIFRLNACARMGMNRLTAEASTIFGAATTYNVGVGTRLAAAWQIQNFTFEAFGRADALTRGPALALDSTFDTGGSSRDNSFRMASTVSTLGLQMGWNFDSLGGAKLLHN